MPAVTLANRSTIVVSGEEAEDFLQNLITTDLAQIGLGEAWPGALLTPQGRIMIEFLVCRTENGLLLECADTAADALVKRLTLYRLRAKVTLEKQQTTAVEAIWGDGTPQNGFVDQRFLRAGITLRRIPLDAGGQDASAYHMLRLANGISGAGEDGALTDFFPHDLLMDKNGGVSFRKGCYVGQEVVSRMQHRSTARRRLVIVSAEQALGEAGAPLLAEAREIGILISAHNGHGLAVLRIDKAGAALAKGASITMNDAAVALALPAWSGLEFPLDADEAAS